MQAQRFPNGGYVAHKVRVNSNVSPMHFSVWFSEQGALLDCEAFDKAGRARQYARELLSRSFFDQDERHV